MEAVEIQEEIEERTNKKTQRFGVGSKSESIPLVGVTAKIEIVEWCAEVNLTQLYQNIEDYPIDATYGFLIDESAAICGFEAFTVSKTIVSTVKPKAQSQSNDTAINEGALPLEKLDKLQNFFQLPVGELSPKQHIVIKITYTTELTLEGGYLRFALPISTSHIKESRKIFPAFDIKIGISLEMNIKMASPILEISCPTHMIKPAIEKGTGNAKVYFSDPRGLCADFVLFTKLDNMHTPKVFVEYDELSSSYVAMISFIPLLEPSIEFNSSNYEIVFFVDRSGSMSGKKIEAARETLQICLRGFTEGTSFNIYAFGDDFEKLYNKSVKLTENSMRIASNYITDLAANMGGTRLLPALKDLYSHKISKGKRDIFIFTDGHLGDKDEVMNLATANKNQRVFVFAIGDTIEEDYCKELAKITEGAVEFVDNENIHMTSAVMKQFRRATGVFIDDIQMEWNGIKIIEFSPRELPNLFQGSNFLAFGIFNDFDSYEKGRAVVRGTFEGKQIEFSVEFLKKDVAPGVMIHRCAAYRVIQDLESELRAFGDDGETKSDLEYWGKTYNISSSQTSYRLEEKENLQTVNSGSSVIARAKTLPSLLERKMQFGDVFSGSSKDLEQFVLRTGTSETSYFSQFVSLIQKRAPLIFLSFIHPIGFIMFFFIVAIYLLHLFCNKKRNLSEGCVVYPKYSGNKVNQINSHMDKLDALLLLMKSDGSWEIDENLSIAIEIPVQKLKENIPSVFQARVAEKMWGTCLALGCIQNHYPHLKEDLKLVFSKAHRFLLSKDPNLNPTILIEIGRQFCKTSVVKISFA